MRVCLLIIAASCCALTACRRAQVPLTHEAYVWQRQWTPAISAALDAAGTTFHAYRVLAAETDRNGVLHPAAPDLAALGRGRREVSAVFRIDGGVPPPDSRALAGRIYAIVDKWRSAGVRLRGIEIDHDCAAARLGDYVKLLRRLRPALPAGLRLSITALPTWLDSPLLPRLLASADESVLQVHAVQAPDAGLFDPAVARRWIDAHAQRSPKPFRVALPAHGLGVGFDGDGKADAAEAKVPREFGAGMHARELRAAPDKIASLLRGLERTRPANLHGIVWFRLPVAGDRRSWSLATLRAVIAGDSLRPAVLVTFDADASGTHDLVLANAGSIDAALPRAIVVAAYGCSAGDAVAGYQLERSGDDWRFVLTADDMLRAGRKRHIGWLRCDTIGGLKVDEDH